jgi:methionyl-tRNA formyltransferase
MRIIFAGTPEFAAAALQALLDARHDVPLVLTQPDRPAGRGMKPKMSAVKTLALEHGLPVSQPLTMRSEEIQAELRRARCEVMIVAAYGLILPKAVLDIPESGCLNIHASLLPRWRGAAPIQRAILAGDEETGITIMQMDEGLDTGGMLLKCPVPIASDDTAQTLHDKLARVGGTCIVQALELLAKKERRPERQDEGLATYAAKLSKEEAVMDWQRGALEADRAVRAYNPFPVAQTTLRGEVLRIWSARPTIENGAPGIVMAVDKSGVLVGCGEGSLLLTELQKAGGKRLDAASFLAGNPIVAGEKLGA